MSKRKKKGGKVDRKPDSYINLTTAIINLIIALILLYEKLSN